MRDVQQERHPKQPGVEASGDAGSLRSALHGQTARVSWGTTNDPGTCRLSDFGDVLVLNELAIVLRTSTRTIKRRLRAGTFPIPTLPSIDKRHRFARADVEKFLKYQQHGRR